MACHFNPSQLSKPTQLRYPRLRQHPLNHKFHFLLSETLVSLPVSYDIVVHDLFQVQCGNVEGNAANLHLHKLSGGVNEINNYLQHAARSGPLKLKWECFLKLQQFIFGGTEDSGRLHRWRNRCRTDVVSVTRYTDWVRKCKEEGSVTEVGCRGAYTCAEQLTCIRFATWCRRVWADMSSDQLTCGSAWPCGPTLCSVFSTACRTTNIIFINSSCVTVFFFFWLGLRKAASTPTSGKWLSPWTRTDRWTFTAKRPSTRTEAGSCTKTLLTCTPCLTLPIRPWRDAPKTPASSYQVSQPPCCLWLFSAFQYFP